MSTPGANDVPAWQAPATPLPRERDELERLILSRFPVVYFDAREEARAERLVLDAARACGRAVWTWSVSEGVVPVGANRIDMATQQLVPALQRVADQPGDDVFVLRDAARFAQDDPVAQRLLRDLAREGRTTVVLLGPHDGIPDGLRGVSASLELPPPDAALIAEHVRSVIERSGVRHGTTNELTPNGFDRLVTALRGLTLDEVDQVLLHLLHDNGRIGDPEVERAVHHKSRILASTGVLALETPTRGMEWIAGLDELKAWIASRARAFTEDAARFGLAAPKGLLLTGVPGCGKSFVAKALAREWNMPLLRLDAGALYEGLIGSSERNLREALGTADALAPSILWIDEIEKGFGMTEASRSDGGLGYRMLGTLATWMQERPHPVFLVATSNDVTKLPPELLRQGRFDEIFFVDLPDLAARDHLFRLQLARVGRDHQRFDCAALAQAAAGFSGAEIEQAVTNGLYAAFAEGAELTTDDIARELARTRPLSALDPVRIERIRAWGSSHARHA